MKEIIKNVNIPRIVIAGTNSGVGKTTIVTGLLAALTEKGYNVQSYKIGPDYIDPGYHRLASGKPAHNLDSWLVPPEKLPDIFLRTAKGCDIAVIEGVMGLYDGGRSGVSSTAAIAKLLKAPVILVINAKSMGESAAAIALGFSKYDPLVDFAGVIVNNLGSVSHKAIVSEALERLGFPVIGYIFRNEGLVTPERHLGLTPVAEHEAADTVLRMGRQIGQEVDIDKIVKLAEAAPPFMMKEELPKPKMAAVRIGVAQDRAFNFYYQESLDVLTSNGALLIPFSPLDDKTLPDVDGLILGGGFPEMFVQELADNNTMKQSIAQAIKTGMPVYAECGGLMYLSKQLTDFEGHSYDMVGVVPAICSMQKKLETVGYIEAMALNDNALAASGQILRGHEFHFSRMTPEVQVAADFPWAFEIKKVRTGAVYVGGYAAGNVLASYLHLHFAGNEGAALRFMDLCSEYGKIRRP